MPIVGMFIDLQGFGNEEIEHLEKFLDVREVQKIVIINEEEIEVWLSQYCTQQADWRINVGQMRKLTEILRFRFDKQLPKKSDFVRIAVREKMERENMRIFIKIII